MIRAFLDLNLTSPLSYYSAFTATAVATNHGSTIAKLQDALWSGLQSVLGFSRIKLGQPRLPEIARRLNGCRGLLLKGVGGWAGQYMCVLENASDATWPC